jgi:uncharacterized protein YndB with AHSA1/START domain
MNLHIHPAPVRKSVHVNASPERAFDVFANGIGRWWPKSHHISKADLDRAVIEPREGGRWYELAVDGSECEVGKVLVWDPPGRLVLAWQLTPDWTYDPNLVTEVEVLFTREAGGTRVDLEHRHLERIGERAAAARESVDSPNGWGLILQLFSEEAAS